MRWLRRAASRLWTPRDIGSCLVDFDPACSALGTTLAASGTTPPAVTISGALNPAQGLYIQVDTAGTPGSGSPTFKWSLDNGSTFQATLVPITATVNLATPAGTITAAFPTAAYATNNIYKATTASCRDLGPNALTLSEAVAANQPQFVAAHASLGNRPCWLWPSVDGTVRLSTSVVTGTAVPVTHVAVGLSLNANPAQVRRLLDHPNGAADTGRQFIGTLSKTTFRCAANNSVSNTLTGDLTSAFVLVATLNGVGAGNVWLNGTQVGTNFDSGSNAITGWRIGGTATASQQWYGPIARFWSFGKVLSSADRIRLEHYCSANWGGFSIAE